jgi:predicted transcriptional regulator
MGFGVLTQKSATAITATVAVAPVQQTLVSMALLTAEDALDETESWLLGVAARLTATERQTNRLIFAGLAAALGDPFAADSFPAYLDGLAATDASALAARVQADQTPTAAALRDEVDRLTAEPPALQQLVINHLRSLWRQHFAPTWEKKQSLMGYMARELNSRVWPDSSAAARFRAVFRRPAPAWLEGPLGKAEQIIFVPSPFMRFQAAPLAEADPTSPTLYLFLWADVWFWNMRTEPIQRSEVLRAISALDDETRLQILEIVAASAEVRAQEIIEQLAVSQSTVSRHLKQLVSAGFLSEERAGDANKLYRLQPARIDEVTYSLSELLSAENAQLVLNDVRLQQPAALRPFLDREGVVTTWPTKRKGQEAVLAYLITKFTVGEQYTEAAVNELLNRWHTYKDPAYLRRGLIDEQLLKRTADGAQYWR